ncbi:MAG: hypothetical protein ACFFBC_08355 [Promethearchaeota archaeon]
MLNIKSSIFGNFEELHCAIKFWAIIIKLRIELNESYKKIIVVRGQT